MPSNLPFAFDINKLNKFVGGDIGIADAIHDLQISPIGAAIKSERDRATFAKLQEPNRNSGLWAAEKAIISTMLESQKPYIELIKICLELFGQLQYTVTVFTGGQNPENDPNSFISAFKANREEMAKFKTGFEPKNAVPDTADEILPETVYLGKYRRNAPSGDVYTLGSGPEKGEFWINKDWPQYQNYNELYDEQINQVLIPQIAILDQETQQVALEGRQDSLSDEWSDMDDKNQIKKNFKTEIVGSNNISKYFKAIETEYLGKPVTVDIEEDYEIKIDKTINPDVNNYIEDFYVTAQLKPEMKGDGSGRKKPENFSGGNIVKTVRSFIKRVLPVIIKKLISAIISLKTVMSKPVDFIGNILMDKLKEHFEMFDPALKNAPKDDPKRNKYYSKDKFLLDGKIAINAGLLGITLGIDNAIPNFKVGAESLPFDFPKEPIIKTVANLAALPINFLKGILDAFTDLLKNLFKVKKLPGVVQNFLSFNWVKDLLKLPKLLEFIGAVNGDITKIPMLNIPTEGNVSLVPNLIQAFLKTIVKFLNGFIQIPNTIMNVQLVPPLPDF